MDGIDVLRECLGKCLGIDPQETLVIRTDVRHTRRRGASIEIAEAFALVGGKCRNVYQPDDVTCIGSGFRDDRASVGVTGEDRGTPARRNYGLEKEYCSLSEPEGLSRQPR